MPYRHEAPAWKRLCVAITGDWMKPKHGLVLVKIVSDSAPATHRGPEGGCDLPARSRTSTVAMLREPLLTVAGVGEGELERA